VYNKRSVKEYRHIKINPHNSYQLAASEWCLNQSAIDC